MRRRENSRRLSARRLRHGRKDGVWISVQTSNANGTELGAQDWRDVLILLYWVEPPDLPYCYDGHGDKFSIPHALDCKELATSQLGTINSVTGLLAWPERP